MKKVNHIAAINILLQFSLQPFLTHYLAEFKKHIYNFLFCYQFINFSDNARLSS